MIAAWMAYATLLGAAAIAVALGAETVLRFYGRPARGAWAAGIAATLLLPLLLLLGGGGGTPAAPMPALTSAPATGPALVIPAPVAFPEALAAALPRQVASAPEATPSAAAALAPEAGAPAAPERASSRLGGALLLLWGAAALVLFLLAGRAALRLRRLRREWGRALLDGTEVRLSARTGPAVAGVLRPEIVVPERMLEWDAEQRRLALHHEREHVRARDPLLLGLGFAAAALLPWNLALWYLLRRLRLAVETDCDARVLAAAPDVRRYGALLLEAGRCHRPVGAGIVCFAESGSFLERRIRAMTTRPPSRRALAAAGIALLCGGAAAAMAGVPVPPAPELRLAAPAADPAPHVLPPVSAAGLEAPAPETPAAPAAPEAPPAPPETLPGDTLLPSLANPAEVSEALRRHYPAALSERGVGGIVLVEARIAADGRVLSTGVTYASDRRLSPAALSAVGAGRFLPARHQGRPVEATVLLPLTFSPQGTVGTAVLSAVSTGGPRGPELAREIYEHGQRAIEERRAESQAASRELYERTLENVQRAREEAERARRARENGQALMRRNLGVIEAHGLQAAIGDPTRYVWLVQVEGRDQVLASGIAAMPPAGGSWSVHDVRRHVESQVPGIQVVHTYVAAGMPVADDGRHVNLAIVSVRAAPEPEGSRGGGGNGRELAAALLASHLEAAPRQVYDPRRYVRFVVDAEGRLLHAEDCRLERGVPFGSDEVLRRFRNAEPSARVQRWELQQAVETPRGDRMNVALVVAVT